MNIIVVDPIFRASRLQYSFMIAQYASNNKYDISILTRTNFFTEQYSLLFENIQHKIYEIVNVDKEFWFGKIKISEIEKIIDEILLLDKNKKVDAIYFAGGHEIFPELSNILIMDKYNSIRDINMLMVDYEPNFLLPIEYKINYSNFFASIKYKMHLIKYKLLKNRQYKRIFDKYKNFNVALLDERVLEVKLNNRFHYIPDPSPSVDVNMYEYKFDEKIKILVVGLQSNRKGFDNIIKLLNKYSDNLRQVKFNFIGRLTDETEKFRSVIKKYSEYIDWEEGYFDDEIMCQKYANSDYVIMPYSKNFSGSSGVMAYATIFSKPLITTSHGCIGYRNSTFKLGYIYDYNNIEELYSLIINLPTVETLEYKKLCVNSKKFAESHSLDKHTAEIAKILNI